jgi:hypothetical protein
VWVAPRYDYQLPAPDRFLAPAYWVANVVARRTFRGGVSGFVRVDNLANHHYQEFVGFPNPGVQARVGMDFVIR